MKTLTDWDCKICGRHFTTTDGFSRHIHATHNISSQDYYDAYEKTESEGKCEVCKKETKFISLKDGYRRFCSSSCGTYFQNHNYTEEQVKQVQEKRVATIRKSLGEDFGKRISEGHKNRSREAKEKSLKQMRETRLRNKNNLSEEEKLIEFKKASERVKKWRKKKGPNYEEERKVKARLTRWQHIHEYEKKNNCTCVTTIQREYGQGYKSLNIPIIRVGVNSYISNEYLSLIEKHALESSCSNRSAFEIELEEFIRTIYDGDIVISDRSQIKPYELDLYLPDINIAIEFNGVYYHSIELDTPEDYHLMKSLMCREKHIRLIHIYEFEDLNEQKELLKNLILGVDRYPKNDFNKNNLIGEIPKPIIIYKDKGKTIFGAGTLIERGG